MFKVFAKEDLLGTSALEGGDPPMGVAFGEMEPTAAYWQYQDLFVSQDYEKIDSLGLIVITADGTILEPCVGVGIEDYCTEMEETSILVSVLGLDAALYERYFPGHVKSYENKFSP